MLTLEGAQAGLSWMTILRKRENYRRAFDEYDLQKIVRYDDRKIVSLLSDPGIVRNRLKVNSVVKNARVVVRLQEKVGTLDALFWRYVDGEPVQNAWTSVSEIPANTGVSDAMSKDLKRLGCSFVGSTICYALMQSIGMVNDHTTDCFRHAELT